MYKNKLAPALAKAKPRKRRFLILEDNDPSGYKSGLGIAAKKEAKINVLPLPKRSPDLNPLDYAFWAELSKRLRKQERRFSPRFVESKEAYVARLRRTAMNFSEETLTKMVCSMKRRCQALKRARGGNFEE